MCPLLYQKKFQTTLCARYYIRRSFRPLYVSAIISEEVSDHSMCPLLYKKEFQTSLCVRYYIRRSFRPLYVPAIIKFYDPSTEIKVLKLKYLIKSASTIGTLSYRSRIEVLHKKYFYCPIRQLTCPP